MQPPAPAPPNPDMTEAIDRSREQALMAMRPDLVRFARMHVRDPHTAEDAVQDALLAALKGEQNFANRASLKTWVFAILRNKIVDLIRVRDREPVLSDLGAEEGEDDALMDALFDAHGHWNTGVTPGRWRDPEDSFEQGQFWTVFELCLDRLPEKTARVFSMREFFGFETEEICKETGVSSTNCFVLLHRARLSLRTCLEERWFAGAVN